MFTRDSKENRGLNRKSQGFPINSVLLRFSPFCVASALMPCWSFHGFEIPGIGTILILERFTIVYGVVASSRYPQTGGCHSRPSWVIWNQNFATLIKQVWFLIRSKGCWASPNTRFKHTAVMFFQLFSGNVGVVILGFGNPWLTRDVPVTTPWLPLENHGLRGVHNAGMHSPGAASQSLHLDCQLDSHLTALNLIDDMVVCVLGHWFTLTYWGRACLAARDSADASAHCRTRSWLIEFAQKMK